MASTAGWALLALWTTGALAATAVDQRSLGLTRWLKNLDAAAAASASLAGSTTLDLAFPGENRFSLTVAESWRGWERLEIELAVPDDLPAGLAVWVYTKDWDFMWRQVCLPLPEPVDGRVLLRLPIAGTAADQAWETVGHRRNWHCLTPEQIKILGLKFEADNGLAYRGRAEIKDVRLAGRRPAELPLTVVNFAFQPNSAQVGSVCEASFELPDFVGSPFKRSELAVDALIQRPDGQVERMPGFYAEDFVLRPIGPQGELMASGRPRFRIRYTPSEAGRHLLGVEIVNGAQQATVPTFAFDVAPATPDYRGFVRVDRRDPVHLSFDNGEWFRGLGVNTRSPNDTRHEAMVPHHSWLDEGLNFYRRVFPIYQAHGINVAEVWMSSWWLALEWIPDAPGNHGVGHFNQQRAWLLDELFRLAAEHDIYLLLVINNHGKFSTFCDQEWARNPFNAANGGFLTDNQAYFSDPQARQAFKQQADYLVARWSYSPNLLAWKLFSEINLTGASHHFYRTPPMIEWHREMSEYLHEIDPHKHLVTTHWSSNYTVINEPIAVLPKLDILTTDAYTGGFGRTDQLLEFLEGTSAYAEQMKKPVIITEFGGHPMGDSMAVLKRQLHLGNWYGVFGKAAIVPMLWWFAIVDEENLYDRYQAVAAFIADEDTRQMQRQSQLLAEDGIRLEILRGRGRTLMWGFEVDYFMATGETAEPRLFNNLTIAVEGLRRGDYTVEFWDCTTGAVLRRESLLVETDGKCQLKLPTFKGDFALKILPAR